MVSRALKKRIEALEDVPAEKVKGVIPKAEIISIKAPKFDVLTVRIEGTAPYMQARFSAKAMQAMKEKMEGGQASRSRKVREPRNFDDDFVQSIHFSEEGWIGVPACAFRNACIDVCRAVGFKMTIAKMSIFIEADGLDKIDAAPLVKLDAPKPERTELVVRNATGVCDIRVRPIWRKWGANIRVRFDADQFSSTDVVNLLSRAGQQIGIGEGRPFGKQSAGLGYGLFAVESVKGGS